VSAQDNAARQYELSELMNLAELACAIDFEGSFVGVSKELLIDYLEYSLPLLLNDAEARARIPAMLDSPKTFKYIRKFVDSRPALSKLWSSLEPSKISVP